MKVIFFLFALLFSYANTFAQKNTNDSNINIYIEKLKISIPTDKLGNNVTVHKCCFEKQNEEDKDSCFSSVHISILDLVGSYNMVCSDSLSGKKVTYSYIGSKKKYRFAKVNVFDFNGKIAKTIKEKNFVPKLNSVKVSIE